MKRIQTVNHQLRDEARRLREANGFSPLLHERCMAALRREGLSGAPDAPTRRPGFWQIAGSLGVAAAAAVGVWFILRAPDSMPAPAPLPRIAIDDSPKTAPPIPVPVAAPANALEERRYAYLDRDAQRLWTFVANQVPSFPTPTDRPAP